MKIGGFFVLRVHLLLQHVERLARETCPEPSLRILPQDLFRIGNVAQFIAGETVETGVAGIQFGAELLRMNNS